VDTSLTLILATCAGLAIVGALAAALAPDTWRAAALLLLAAATAGALASLGAGFAALIALIALGAAAPLLAESPVSPRGLPARPAAVAAVPSRRLAAQLGAVGAALILLLFGFAALRVDFLHSSYRGGWLGTAAMGRLLLGHDALAADAVAGLLFVGLVAQTWTGWGRR